jgi:hypothetical protein
MEHPLQKRRTTMSLREKPMPRNTVSLEVCCGNCPFARNEEIVDIGKRKLECFALPPILAFPTQDPISGKQGISFMHVPVTPDHPPCGFHPRWNEWLALQNAAKKALEDEKGS